MSGRDYLSRYPGPLALLIFPLRLPQISPRLRGCVVDVPAGAGHPQSLILSILTVVGLCNALHLLQKGASLRWVKATLTSGPKNIYLQMQLEIRLV